MDIVLFLSNDWDDLWAAQQKIAVELSKHHRVIAFETFGFTQRSLIGADYARITRRFSRLLKGGIQYNKNLRIEPSPAFPFLRFKHLGAMNHAMIQNYVKHVLRKYDFNKPLFWTFLPSPKILRLAENLSNAGLVYECLDDFSKFTGAPGDFEDFERKLVDKTNVFFASSEKQVELKKRYHTASYLSHNASDVDHFRKVLDPLTKVHPQIAAIRKPLIGFIGSFDFWVDTELIQWVADHHPDWSVVLIGPYPYLQESMPQGHNVFVLGQKPYSELPSLIKGIDVGILPFRSNTYMETADPIIMYDWLSSGKEVVATDFPAVRHLKSGLVRVSQSPQGFVANIEAALIDQSSSSKFDLEAKASRRSDAMREHSWEHRVSKQLEIISRHMSR